MRLTVIGTGYVGLNTGVAAAYLGHDVVCVDKDHRKLELLNNGKSPIHEQGLDELLAQVRHQMQFTDDTADAVRDADVILIAVGTPPKENGEADTRYVEEAARDVRGGPRTRPYIHARGQVNCADRFEPPCGPRRDQGVGPEKC